MGLAVRTGGGGSRQTFTSTARAWGPATTVSARGGGAQRERISTRHITRRTNSQRLLFSAAALEAPQRPISEWRGGKEGRARSISAEDTMMQLCRGRIIISATAKPSYGR